MNESQVREIIRQELSLFIRSDRFTFQKDVQMLDGRNFQLATGVGTKFGTGTGQKMGFFNVTPIVQPSSAGEDAGFTAGAGTTVTHQSTFTGNTGSTAYKIGDIIKHLKLLGFLAS